MVRLVRGGDGDDYDGDGDNGGDDGEVMVMVMVIMVVVMMIRIIMVVRYFSHWDNICKPYNYSGCGANLNHFLSEVDNFHHQIT